MTNADKGWGEGEGLAHKKRDTAHGAWREHQPKPRAP